MSFILDALKKSEKARQRQAGPSLFEVKIAAPRRTLPAWAVILGMLLAVNAAVVAWMMLGRPARRASPAASRSAAAAPEAGPAGRRARAARSASPPPGGSPTALHAAASAPAVPTTTSTAASSASQAHTAPAPAGSPPSLHPDAAASDYAPAVEPSDHALGDTGLPLYREVDSAPGESLPSLHLDLHVYDSDPSKRFVMINMHKLKQGGSLPDGVKVVSIRPDGVVLSYQGRRFLLPR